MCIYDSFKCVCVCVCVCLYMTILSVCVCVCVCVCECVGLGIRVRDGKRARVKQRELKPRCRKDHPLDVFTLVRQHRDKSVQFLFDVRGDWVSSRWDWSVCESTQRASSWKSVSWR